MWRDTMGCYVWGTKNDKYGDTRIRPRHAQPHVKFAATRVSVRCEIAIPIFAGYSVSAGPTIAGRGKPLSDHWALASCSLDCRSRPLPVSISATGYRAPCERLAPLCVAWAARTHRHQAPITRDAMKRAQRASPPSTQTSRDIVLKWTVTAMALPVSPTAVASKARFFAFNSAHASYSGLAKQGSSKRSKMRGKHI